MYEDLTNFLKERNITQESVYSRGSVDTMLWQLFLRNAINDYTSEPNGVAVQVKSNEEFVFFPS